MADPIDISGDIALAINTAFERGNPIVLGYIDHDGRVSLSPRGSAHVRNDRQLAVWARKPDAGLAAAVATRPDVTLFFWSANDGGPKMLLNIKGRARVDPSLNDEVYEGMIESERNADAERNGVAVIVDVQSLVGGGRDYGRFNQSA